MILFPNIDRIAFSIFNIDIYWYALAYVFGIILGYLCAVRTSAALSLNFSKQELEKFASFAIMGIIIGGRLGHVFFFEPDYYLSNPVKIFAIREGGMSFHGGFIGMVTACALFCHINRKQFLELTDIVAVSAPIGLFLGRLGNFINSEVIGRVTTVPWGVIFPGAGPLPRHPSQIYEALSEGVLLFVVLSIAVKTLSKGKYKVGTLSYIFCICYAIFRFLIEFVREPDEDFNILVTLYTGITIGQWLCLPIIICGIYLYLRTRKLKDNE